MQISKISNSNQAKTQNFNGHWKEYTAGASYPYEDSTVSVKTYVADADESFDEITRNFQAKAGRRDIFEASHHTIYTIGGTNYFTDLSQNREAKKQYLTKTSEQKLKDKKWVEAVEDKLNIAKILKEQGPKMDRDRFLTEEGIRSIFHQADNDSKMSIAAIVSEYNVDMSKSLLKVFKRVK